MMIISLVTGVAVLLLFLWTVIPPLRGMAVKERDDENPYGETVSIIFIYMSILWGAVLPEPTRRPPH